MERGEGRGTSMEGEGDVERSNAAIIIIGLFDIDLNQSFDDLKSVKCEFIGHATPIPVAAGHAPLDLSPKAWKT